LWKSLFDNQKIHGKKVGINTNIKRKERENKNTIRVCERKLSQNLL